MGIKSRREQAQKMEKLRKYEEGQQRVVDLEEAVGTLTEELTEMLSTMGISVSRVDIPVLDSSDLPSARYGIKAMDEDSTRADLECGLEKTTITIYGLSMDNIQTLHYGWPRGEVHGRATGSHVVLDREMSMAFNRQDFYENADEVHIPNSFKHRSKGPYTVKLDSASLIDEPAYVRSSLAEYIAIQLWRQSEEASQDPL